MPASPCAYNDISHLPQTVISRQSLFSRDTFSTRWTVSVRGIIRETRRMRPTADVCTVLDNGMY